MQPASFVSFFITTAGPISTGTTSVAVDEALTVLLTEFSELLLLPDEDAAEGAAAAAAALS